MKEPLQKESYLTSDVPGTGGRIRVEFEDFRVEEIPLKAPEGLGEHLYIWVEKRGISTLGAVRALARLLGANEGDIGYAGLKDARAVTRQWISVRAAGPAAERKLDGSKIAPKIHEGLTVLEMKRGRSKLRRGSLRGNRFDVRVRGTFPGAIDRARETLAALAARGVPNAFGDQRFGLKGNSAEVGLALALGRLGWAVDRLLGPSKFEGHPRDRNSPEPREEGGARSAEAARRFGAGDLQGALRLYPESWRAERRVLTALIGGAAPEKAVRAIPRRERALFASAFQAAVFNDCLAARLAEGTHDRILAGDVVVSHLSGNVRRVGDPAKEAAALARFEVSPAGPLIGGKTLEARRGPGEMEAKVLLALGLAAGAAEGDLARLGARGGRRPYRARLDVLDAAAEGSDLCLRFELPPGAYATEVLREVMKVESPLRAGYYLDEASWCEPPRQKGGGV